MHLICVKKHVVFIKPFWYYYKGVSESADHNASVFAGRIHSTVMCIVAECSSFNEKKEKIINENVEK